MFSAQDGWELDMANATAGCALRTGEPVDDDDELGADASDEATWATDGALSLSADGRRREGDNPGADEDLDFAFDDDEDVDDDNFDDDFDDDDGEDGDEH